MRWKVGCNPFTWLGHGDCWVVAVIRKDFVLHLSRLALSNVWIREPSCARKPRRHIVTNQQHGRWRISSNSITVWPKARASWARRRHYRHHHVNTRRSQPYRWRHACAMPAGPPPSPTPNLTWHSLDALDRQRPSIDGPRALWSPFPSPRTASSRLWTERRLHHEKCAILACRNSVSRSSTSCEHEHDMMNLEAFFHCALSLSEKHTHKHKMSKGEGEMRSALHPV